MIARVWHATATDSGSGAYRRHFEQNVLPQLRSLNGFLRAFLMTREDAGMVRIEVLTLWDSLDAIKAFASPDVEAAVVEQEARDALSDFGTTVTHFVATEYGN